MRALCAPIMRNMLWAKEGAFRERVFSDLVGPNGRSRPIETRIAVACGAGPFWPSLALRETSASERGGGRKGADVGQVCGRAPGGLSFKGSNRSAGDDSY